MKKKILFVLIFCVILLYSYNIFLLFTSTNTELPQQNSDLHSNEMFDKFLKISRHPHFVKQGKSPFEEYTRSSIIQKTLPAPVNEIKKSAVPTTEISKPAIVITGIMWSETNPVAMVNLPDGSSTIVKASGVYGNITVKKIEKNRIQIVCEKKQFWIDR